MFLAGSRHHFFGVDQVPFRNKERILVLRTVDPVFKDICEVIGINHCVTIRLCFRYRLNNEFNRWPETVCTGVDKDHEKLIDLE